ncbi:hypothetical protein [Rhodoflexus sp.]
MFFSRQCKMREGIVAQIPARERLFAEPDLKNCHLPQSRKGSSRMPALISIMHLLMAWGHNKKVTEEMRGECAE